MHTGFDNLLVNGLLICLYGQLFLIGIFNFLNNTKRNFVLGAICCLVSFSFIYSIFWTSINKSVFFNILIGGYKHLFLPSLIFLYLALITARDANKLIYAHLTAPLFVHVTYLLLKLGVTDFYSTHIDVIVLCVNMFILLSYIFYVKLGVDQFNVLKNKIMPRIYKRYLFFFWILMGYGALLAFNSVLPYALGEASYKATFRYLSDDLYLILAALVNLGILVFAFVESPSLRQFVVAKNIYQQDELVKDIPQIESFITQVFKEQKAYKNVDFDVQMALAKSGIKPKHFKFFINKEYRTSVVEFINNHRVEEFKMLLQASDSGRYSFIGVAQEAGFVSKATFYRHFKRKEGITPKQYLATLKENSSPS